MQKKCSKCKEENKEYYTWNTSVCRDCEKKRKRDASKIYWEKNGERVRASLRANYHKKRDAYLVKQKGYRDAQRDKVFMHYGGYECVCCKEKEPTFLTIDHIDGGGTKQRKELRGGGMWVYRWIWNNNFPAGFQVMCMNCNYGKGQNFRRNGINLCPHQPKS